MKQKNAAIDLLKFLFAMMILLFHGGKNLPGQVSLFPNGRIGVEFFFLVSGYLMAASAARLIKFGGKFFMCCPAERLAEAICALTANSLEPKRLRLAAATPDKAPYLAFIEAKKGAKAGLRIEKQLTVCGADGCYTPEVRRIYHKDDE